jgi:hypothetical protein
MAVRSGVAAASVACLLAGATGRAQSITTEAAVTGGYSTDHVAAAAVQLRAIGDITGGVRFFGEVAWARTSDTDNDGFATAYPYDNRVEVIEAYGERIFRPRDALLAARGGRFRTPFGIYNGSDHAYSGFLRPPLIRYDEYSGISNNFLEHGVDVTVGVPQLTLETSLGAPADVGTAVRRSGLDAVARLQGSYGPIIAGVSHIRTSPLQSVEPAHAGPAEFTGIDLRWMYGGVQLRGEWLTGHPFEGANTTGWYADSIVHMIGMGPVTAVARIEQLDYEDPGEAEAFSSRRDTVGARARLAGGFSVIVNLVHRQGDLKGYRRNSFDAGLTWSVRRGPS